MGKIAFSNCYLHKLFTPDYTRFCAVGKAGGQLGILPAGLLVGRTTTLVDARWSILSDAGSIPAVSITARIRTRNPLIRSLAPCRSAVTRCRAFCCGFWRVLAKNLQFWRSWGFLAESAFIAAVQADFKYIIGFPRSLTWGCGCAGRGSLLAQVADGHARCLRGPGWRRWRIWRRVRPRPRSRAAVAYRAAYATKPRKSFINGSGRGRAFCPAGGPARP